MRVLITGIAGFLGSHLADKLLADGHEVFGVDNLIGGYRENVPLEVKEWAEADSASVIEMSRLVKEWKPDVIYHCACTAYEGLSVFSPAFVVQNTLQNTLGILSAAIQSGVKRFIYTSSMSRYGKQETPFCETMETRPVDPYGVAKCAAEHIVSQMAETHGFEYVIAVPHNIIGPRQKYDDPYRNVASIMINLMLQNRQPIIYGNGLQKRSFSFVRDCTETLSQMLTCKSSEIYNIGPDNQDSSVVTIHELFDTIARLIGFTGRPIYVPDRPREVKEAWCSSDKIRREFNFAPSVSLAEGLQEMIDDIKSKGTKPFQYDHVPLEIKQGAPATWKERMF
jgi:UDP-glucose 4-epimerase